jgi:hypothetical protein
MPGIVLLQGGLDLVELLLGEFVDSQFLESLTDGRALRAGLALCHIMRGDLAVDGLVDLLPGQGWLARLRATEILLVELEDEAGQVIELIGIKLGRVQPEEGSHDFRCEGLQEVLVLNAVGLLVRRGPHHAVLGCSSSLGRRVEASPLGCGSTRRYHDEPERYEDMVGAVQHL